MTEEKKLYLETALKSFEKMQFACVRILNDESEEVVCKELNIDKRTFRKILFSGRFTYDGKYVDVQHQDDILLTPYEQLYCDICGLRGADVSFPPELEETLPYLINKRLINNEKDVINQYYFENKTLDAIGKEKGVQRERIRQVLKNGLRRLRHPMAYKVIMNGMHYVRTVEQVEQEYITTNLIPSLKKEVEGAIKKNDFQELVNLQQRITKQLHEFHEASSSIENLDLSTRTYNALRRAGINSTNDLQQLSTKQLYKIKNLGAKSRQEIVEKCNQYNIYVDWELEK